MENPVINQYLSSIHGTQVGGLISELGNKFLPDTYHLPILNDRETVGGMLAVLKAIEEKLQKHYDTHPFKH